MRRSVLAVCALAVSGLVLLGLGISEQAFSEEGSAAGKARPSDPDIWAKQEFDEDLLGTQGVLSKT